MTINRFFHHFNTLEVHELSVGFKTAIDGQADFPRTGKYLGIFNGGFVTDRILADRCIPLDDVQGIAMEVTGPIEPSIWRETGDIDYQRVPIPAAGGVSHVRIAGIRFHRI